MSVSKRRDNDRPADAGEPAKDAARAIGPIRPALPVPRLATAAGDAVFKCADAAALACEQLAETVRANADKTEKYLRAIAAEYRRQGALAQQAVETVGADMQHANGLINELRARMDGDAIEGAATAAVAGALQNGQGQ